MDYGDVIYGQPLNEYLSNGIESVQYKAAIAITGVIQGLSGKKLYQELGLEHLDQRQWMKRLCLFYKIFHSKEYQIHSFYCRTEYFQNSFLSYIIKEWNKLDPDKRSC